MPDHIELEDIVTAQIEQQAYENVNRCVCCGAVIPEGRHVCATCEAKVDNQTT